jgi:hypothetical protein
MSLHDHCRLRPIHEECERVLSRHTVALVYFAGAMGDRDLKDGLCQVYGDGRIVTHEMAPFMPSQRDSGTSMPIQSREESISSMQLTGRGGLVWRASQLIRGVGQAQDAWRRMKRTAIVILAVTMAVAFGIVHNLVTVQISPANFTVGHARIVPTNSPVVLAIAWGLVTPFVAGLIVGVPLSMIATVGSKPQLSTAQLALPIAALCMAMAVGSIAGGAVGYARARSGSHDLPESLARRVPVHDLVRFASIRTAHTWAHRAGFAGGVVLWLYAWRIRRAQPPIGA